MIGSQFFNGEIQTFGRSIVFINKFGKIAVFGLPPAEVYDPDTGGVTSGVLVEYRQKVSPPADYANKLVDGDLIKIGDTMVLLPGKDLTFVPIIGSSVTMDSLVWKIITSKPIFSGEQVAVYELQLRR